MSSDEDVPIGNDIDRKLITFNGYHVLPINLATSSLVKHLYFKSLKKRKSSSVDDDAIEEVDSDSRTIYVTNLSPSCTEKDLRSIFEVCGAIESVRFDAREKPRAANALDIEQTLQNLLEKHKSAPNSTIAPTASSSQSEFMKSRLERLQNSIFGQRESGKYPFESAGFALITFADEDAFDFAMTKLSQMSCFGKSERYSSKSSSNGLKAWLKNYMSNALPDTKVLQHEADVALQMYDRRQRRQAKLEQQLSTTKDDDGWTLVAPRGRKRARDGEFTVGSSKLSQGQLREIKAEQDKRTQMDDFYRFQKYDTQQSQIDNLRHKFAQDKAKIQRIQNNRRFKQ